MAGAHGGAVSKHGRQVGDLAVSAVQALPHRFDLPLLSDGEDAHGAGPADEVARGAREVGYSCGRAAVALDGRSMRGVGAGHELPREARGDKHHLPAVRAAGAEAQVERGA